MFWVLKRTVSLRRGFLSTHNICFGLEIRKLFFCYALLTKVLEAKASLPGTHNIIKVDERCINFAKSLDPDQGAQWLNGRVLDLRPRGCGFEPHRHL